MKSVYTYFGRVLSNPHSRFVFFSITFCLFHSLLAAGVCRGVESWQCLAPGCFKESGLVRECRGREAREGRRAYMFWALEWGATPRSDMQAHPWKNVESLTATRSCLTKRWLQRRVVLDILALLWNRVTHIYIFSCLSFLFSIFLSS